MSLAQLMRDMLAAGAPMEAVIMAVEAVEARDNAAAEVRAKAAARKQAQRDRERDSHGTVTGQSCDNPSPDKETPHTPKKLTPSAHTHEAGARKAWACPAGVEQPHWSDFLANRRSKRLTNTATAYAGQLKALSDLSDDEWPPGRLVQFAAERGWASINDPRNSPYSTGTGNGRSGTHPMARNRADDPGRTLGAGSDFLAARRVAAH